MSVKAKILVASIGVLAHIGLLGMNYCTRGNSYVFLAFTFNGLALVFHACRIVYLLRAAPKPQQSELERVIYRGQG